MENEKKSSDKSGLILWLSIYIPILIMYAITAIDVHGKDVNFANERFADMLHLLIAGSLIVQIAFVVIAFFLWLKDKF